MMNFGQEDLSQLIDKAKDKLHGVWCEQDPVIFIMGFAACPQYSCGLLGGVKVRIKVF